MFALSWRSAAQAATAPFVGAVSGVFALGEPPTPQLLVAAVLMAAGLALASAAPSCRAASAPAHARAYHPLARTPARQVSHGDRFQGSGLAKAHHEVTALPVRKGPLRP